MKCKILFLIGIFIAGFASVSHSQNVKEDSTRIQITRLALNSNRGDFSPFLVGNKLYFTTGRVHRYGLVYIDADTTKELEDVFYAEEIDSVDFKRVHYFSEKVNTKYNDGPLCFNKTGDVIYITGNDEKRMIKQMEPLDIFVSTKIDGKWSHPASLPFCTGTSSYCHPALLHDGKTLIFSSDMPGGIGGMDLYITKLENGNWSKPQNLGNGINSADNEVFPFINADDILYFSSNRKTGVGGLDIYSIDLKDPLSSELIQLPAPFNSAKDDFGVWADSLGNSGYFSSNRGERGDDDIYYFKNKYPNFGSCATFKKPAYCYTFFEESTLAAEDSSGMTYEWDLGDGTKMRGIKARHCFRGTGNYSIQLNIIDKASGALFYNELSYDFTVEDPKQLYINCSDTLARGKKTKIDSKRSVIPGYTIKEFFWFFGDGKLATGPETMHAYTADGEYMMQMGVIAKNDSTGKVKNFCVQKNILVKDSIWIKQHESSHTKTVWPPPHPVDSLYHVKQGDSVNFRVHLGSSRENISTNSKIFKGLKDVRKFRDKGIFRYTSGDVKKLSDAIPYYRKAKERGFKDAIVVSFYSDSLIPKQERSLKGEIIDSKVVSIELDTTKIVDSYTLLFDFDKTTINDNYKPALDSIVDRMKTEKELDLVVLSISDTVGTSEYNYKLSKRRAIVVQKYFSNEGVKKRRISILPLGENVPLEYEQRKNIVISNRRVELLLIKKAK